MALRAPDGSCGHPLFSDGCYTPLGLEELLGPDHLGGFYRHVAFLRARLEGLIAGELCRGPQFCYPCMGASPRDDYPSLGPLQDGEEARDLRAPLIKNVAKRREVLPWA